MMDNSYTTTDDISTISICLLYIVNNVQQNLPNFLLSHMWLITKSQDLEQSSKIEVLEQSLHESTDPA